MLYHQTTNNVTVSVRPMYRRDDSAPKKNLFVWTYEISILNESPEPIQLLDRYWKISDADNRVQEVRGPGVVGQRPVIQPQSTFSYTSFTHLPTSSGKMVGSYKMTNEQGVQFDVYVPPFKLMLPVRLLPDLPNDSTNNVPPPPTTDLPNDSPPIA